MTSLKLYARYGSTHVPGAAPLGGAAGGVGAASGTLSLRVDLHATGVLTDAEDDELGWLDRRNADDRHDHSRIDDVVGGGFLVALDEERFLGRAAHECAVAPPTRQEGADVAADRFPQCSIVGLEDDPARRLGDRLLYHVDQAGHVEVAPLARGIVQRARAPDADPLAREVSNAVHARRIEHALLFERQALGDVEGATDELVGRRLVHTALRIVACPDARNMS